VADVDDALVRLRTVLRDYRDSLTQRHPRVEVSPLEALRTLATIASMTPQPSAATRFDIATLQSLGTRRAEAAQALATAARLGEFRFGPDDSPWYGVAFASTQEARDTHALAGRLHRTEVPAMLERGYELIAQTRMRPFSTLAELGAYVQLLQGIRASLDRFSTTVFERPLAELIQAHAPRRDAPAMTSPQRRRLKNLSREYVRPGMHITDMHESLVRVQQQRAQWQQLVDPGVMPEIPLGLDDVATAWQRVAADLGRSIAHWGAPNRSRRCRFPTCCALSRAWRRPPTSSTTWSNVPLRGELADGPGGAHRAVVRHVPEEHVAAEFEFAWWQSALERCCARTGRCSARTRRSSTGSNAITAWSTRRTPPRRVRCWRRSWRRRGRSPSSTRPASRALKQRCAAASRRSWSRRRRSSCARWRRCGSRRPTKCPRSRVAAVRRGHRRGCRGAVPCRGGARAASRAPGGRLRRPGDAASHAFRVGAGHASAEDEPDVPFDEVSVFERLTELVPVETLTRSYRAGGEDLAELVNGAFYEGRLVSYPWAGSYLGRGSLSVDYVEGGTGAPDPITGAVESPDAEVARVVTLVVEHAVNRPTETLMVVTASVRHAERVRAAVAAAFAGRSDVAEFVGRDTAEPFAVLGLEESVAESRDRVVFSLGFGLTKHGRVLSDFGDLSGPDGERLLTVGMTRARRSMVIVSSIRPSAFDEGRLESGAATLMSILGGIAARARESRLEDLADPLTLALAGHLRALGIAVDVNYRGILPLVAQHRGKAVVVESDADSMGRPCVRACAAPAGAAPSRLALRARARLRPVQRPGGVAGRIAAILGASPETPRAETVTEPLDLR
jgi:hypothetical protein